MAPSTDRTVLEQLKNSPTMSREIGSYAVRGIPEFCRTSIVRVMVRAKGGILAKLGLSTAHFDNVTILITWNK